MRLLPLVLILLLSGGIVLVFRSANLRNQLDDSVFEVVSSRTFHAVEDYFNPLIELSSSSVLWGRIGEVDSIGTPDNYIGLLEKRLEGIGTVSSFSMSDGSGREIDLVLTAEGTDNWKETTTGDDNSLSSARTAAGIEYLTIEDQETSPPPALLKGESRFKISTPYLLPSGNVPGITMRIEDEMIICFDLPLSEMARRINNEGTVEDAVIFLLMPSRKDFIILPVKNLIKTDEIILENFQESIPAELTNNMKGLIEEISNSDNTTIEGNIRFRFISDNQIWLAEFLNIEIGDEILSMGTLAPESSLWTAQISGPLQIILLALLASIGFLIFRLLQDYIIMAQSPFRVEESIRDEISKGESFHLEFKSSLRWDYKNDEINKALEDIIVKSIAAFSNADGGILLIGVGDSGEILGIEKDYDVLRQPGRDYYEIHLRNLLGSKYGVGYTSKNISVDFPWLSGHEICRIKIRRGRLPLYTIAKSKNGSPVEKFYVRSGNTSQVLDKASEITAYILSRFSRWSLRNR